MPAPAQPPHDSRTSMMTTSKLTSLPVDGKLKLNMLGCIAESSLGDLFRSAVNAYPHTTMRQHATGPIVIDEVRAVPFLGMNTLLMRCRATNEERVYRPVVLFRNVNYTGDGATITASDNKQTYNFNPLSEDGTNCRVRCQCGDFFWRFHHYDWVDLSLYSANRKPYEPTSNRGPINPTESPGICKHLMKFMEVLRGDGIFGGE